MASASKLEELELTREEVDRFSAALKDEKFRKMLSEYAEEISKPENKKKYEEEITQLEKERGVDVKFVHPIPGHVLKTSVNGDKKCFINVCSNDLINKPVCKPRKGNDGALGQHWSLPYSLTPGREDLGAGGKKHLIYDVVFHPDTLYMAERNERFRKMVDEISLDAIEKQLSAKLDLRNVKTLKLKYKGMPHATVIRKPLPGGPKELPEEDSPLRFPYPYDLPKSENASRSDIKDQSTAERSNAAGKDKNKKMQENKFTQPKYSIVYRSTFDMQDYRYARDAAPSTRPKELVVTIDLPLLNSAENACLDVTEKLLCLESQKPAYKLDLTLPYPVDENQGSAKFNKSKRQLVVTLPVVPAKQVPEMEKYHSCDFEPEGKDSDSTENDQSPLKPELYQSEGDSHQKNGESNIACINYEDGRKDSNWEQSQTNEHLGLSHITKSISSGVKVTTSISSNHFLKPSDVIVSPQIVSEVDSEGQKNLPEESAVASNDQSFHGSLEKQCSSTIDGQINEHPQVNSSENTKFCSEYSLKENEPVCPDFHYHQNESTVTFILKVRNINENSLKSVIHTHDYNIMFGTTDSDILYSLIIQFPAEHQLDTRESILNISKDNAAVVLIKLAESRGLWQSFCAGHTHNSLQKKLFVTSENADQFLSTSLKDSVPADPAEKCSAVLRVSEVSESGLVIYSKFQQQEKDEISSHAHDLNHNGACSTPSNIQQHGEEIGFTESIASDDKTEKDISLVDNGVEFVSSQQDELGILSGNSDNYVQLHSSSEGTGIILKPGVDQVSHSSCMNPVDGNKLISEIENESQSVTPASDLDVLQAEDPISLNNESSASSDCAKREDGNNETLDEDDLPTDQMNDSDSEFVKQTAPFQILEEVNPVDKSMKVICDHTTHSAFTFQNTELYQLD
ncbi:protein kintoun [Pristis pectinata]|uniref:protein kintoun n=1 Tax=Pristis pectinata TaxID=685728 RepID=UPI00223DEEDB|nr:protein kintoun [Pristis pectinata]